MPRPEPYNRVTDPLEAGQFVVLVPTSNNNYTIVRAFETYAEALDHADSVPCIGALVAMVVGFPPE